MNTEESGVDNVNWNKKFPSQIYCLIVGDIWGNRGIPLYRGDWG